MPNVFYARGQARVEPDSPPPAGEVYVAVVHAREGVRFATAGPSRAELVRRLAEYARVWAEYTLWPDDARYVRSLLVRGELEAAVEVYFGRVGERWDEEWLVTAVLPASAHAEVDGSVGAVAPAPGRSVGSRSASAR